MLLAQIYGHGVMHFMSSTSKSNRTLGVGKNQFMSVHKLIIIAWANNKFLPLSMSIHTGHRTGQQAATSGCKGGSVGS